MTKTMDFWLIIIDEINIPSNDFVKRRTKNAQDTDNFLSR
jgi:hypothetical protein